MQKFLVEQCTVHSKAETAQGQLAVSQEALGEGATFLGEFHSYNVCPSA